MLFSVQKYLCFVFLLTLFPGWVQGQSTQDSLLLTATLDNVVQYALTHQPAVQQALVDEQIANKVIKGKLADWYPQINFTYNYQRFFDLNTAVFDGRVIPIGLTNTSSTQFTATQNIFNRDALLASSTASKVRIAASQNTSRSKIDLVVDVTKAFYDVLATSQQVRVSEQSIKRLEESLTSALDRYNAGVADKTDYKRATILLGNAKAERKTNMESLKFKEH